MSQDTNPIQDQFLLPITLPNQQTFKLIILRAGIIIGGATFNRYRPDDGPAPLYFHIRLNFPAFIACHVAGYPGRYFMLDFGGIDGLGVCLVCGGVAGVGRGVLAVTWGWGRRHWVHGPSLPFLFLIFGKRKRGGWLKSGRMLERCCCLWRWWEKGGFVSLLYSK